MEYLEGFRKTGVSWLVAMLFCAGCSRQQPTLQKARDLNVLFVTLDTTRADHLSCYQSSARGIVRGARTPHLDSLAAHGTRFAHATAQVPLTLPSHACIFTGTYPEVHQLRDMGGFGLDPKHTTLATMARNAGFLTAAFVGSKAVSHQLGLQQGFDVYDDQMTRQGEEDKLPGIFPERRAAVTTDRALSWLEQYGRRKFFIWVHYYDPHAPYDPPEPYKRTYSEDRYSGEIAYTDEQVGRLLDFLDHAKIKERTLVIVMGDHGEGLNDHGEKTHGIFLYDETLHIPLIIAGPGVPPGQVINPQVRSIDLLPTVAEFLGLPPNLAAQGISLWPLMKRGKSVAGSESNYAYIETLYPKTYMNWSELRGMRTDRWKFILAPRPELYDLESDQGEKENVIDQHPAEADHLRKKIWEVIGPPAENRKLVYVPVDTQTRQELASLGYISAGTPRQITLDGTGPDPKDRVTILAAMQQYDLFMNQRSYMLAAQAMQNAIPKDPTNPLARLYLATAYEKLGHWTRVVQTYRSAVEIGVAGDQILSRLGKAYLRLNDVENAVAAMEKARDLNPTDLDNLRNLGIAYLQSNRLTDAEKAFKAIIVQDDRYASAFNGLGLVAIQRGDGDTARPNFEKALELDSEQVEPLLNLGLLYQNTGHKEQALHYFTLFLEKAPPEEYAHLLPKVREAIQDLRKGG